jgi:transcriptional regulator with XRE-family HTH domain
MHAGLLLPNCLRVPHDRCMEENSGREGRVVATVPSDTFDHRLMLARSHAGRLTIQEAAAKCGVTHQSWSNWERGRIPRDKVEVADAIAEGLGIDRDWLLHGGPLTSPDKPRRLRVAYARRSIRPGQRVGPRRARRLDRIPA